jgi:hypothetical protein
MQSSETGPSSSISPETVKHAAICGLSAAATKSKLFADQEEREIQRLAATIINHQVCCSTKFMVLQFCYVGVWPSYFLWYCLHLWCTITVSVLACL